MLKKLFKWLRGEDTPNTISVLHIRSWDETTKSDLTLHLHCRNILKSISVGTSEDQHIVVNYHDIATKTPDEKLLKILQEYSLKTGYHGVIVHNGTDSQVWDKAEWLAELLLVCHGFTSVSVLGYSVDHQKGNAYVYHKVANGMPYKYDFESDHFMDKGIRDMILTGKHI